MGTGCNCVEHFCCGYEAGIKAERDKQDKMPEILLDQKTLEDRANDDSGFRFEGYYDVIVYVPSDKSPFVEPDEWRKLIETLIAKCGVIVSKLTFRAVDEGISYSIGLKES